MSRPRVLFVQPSAQPPGGGNGVIAWMLHALQDDYDVSLMTYVPFDAEPLNRYYGTRIDAAKIRAWRALPRIYEALARIPVSLWMIKISLLARSLREIHERFDLIISANNELNFGRAGIQYVHFPAQHPRPSADIRHLYHRSVLIAPYQALCRRLSGASHEAIVRNVTLVNSDWTGEHMASAYPGITTTTLYPPVAGDFEDVPWEDREPGFLAISRISPEKQWDRIFDIVGAVRRNHPEVRLHIVGSRVADTAYYEHVLARAAAERSWVIVHEDVSRAELAQLVSRQRFGIHAMPEEHFGMGVAEMVRAGCVVWVPDGGGQVEIVGRDERLVYRSDADAVDKIGATLDDAERMTAVREHLRPYRERFSEQLFVARFREVVRDFLAERGGSSIEAAAAARFQRQPG